MEKQKSFVVELFETFVSSTLVLLVIYMLLAFPEVVFGASMEPSLYTGERILVERVTKHFTGFSRGDVVVLHPPSDDHIDYVKRVVGIPGDIVKFYDCKVFITRDGEKFELSEPYLSDGTCTVGGLKLKDGRAVKLNEGEYIVLGDNREKSVDSRTFGYINEERILGKVILKFWPIAKFEFL